MTDSIIRTYRIRQMLNEHVRVSDVDGTTILEPENLENSRYPNTAISLRGQEPYSPARETSRLKNDLYDPQKNAILRVANQYMHAKFGHGLDVSRQNLPVSSLNKQYSIAKAYDLAADKNPSYEQSVFEDYQRRMPETIRRHNIHDYPSLVSAAYRQAAKETKEQFDILPLKLQFHNGNLGYHNSNEMLRDIHLHGNMTVYKGGDMHDFFHHNNPKTGLSENDIFRAVHDAFGHAIHGNQFGAGGEEIAYHVHQQMYSPLARLATASETRGQNSNVNYTTRNLGIRDEIESLRKQQHHLNNIGDFDGANDISKKLREVGANWKYAKQAAVVLPHAMLSSTYKNTESPAYLGNLLKDPAAISNPIYDVQKDHLGIASLAKHHNTGSQLLMNHEMRGQLNTKLADKDLLYLSQLHGFSNFSQGIK